MIDDALTLTPVGAPPSRGDRWCPRCTTWIAARGRRRCPTCLAALVRAAPAPPKLRPGELRPGVIEQFRDPRDWPAPDFRALRRRLKGGS